MIGKIIGKYKVLEAIGAGGMATVFLASHCDVPSLKVVLKKLTDPLLVDRFKREADKLAVLDGHSGICQIKHFFAFKGDFYIVMEYIDGPTLDELIKSDNPPDMEGILKLVRSILVTLDYAHRQGIVHRDIKPTNIMVDRNGQIKIIDFGVAKGATDPDLTQVGTSLGSPRYMAPEQFNPQGAIDWVRCDLYAVGMTLYYMLTRHLPFHGANIYEVCDAKRSQDPPAPSLVNPAIPPVLDAVVMKAMARNPEDRHATAAEMRNDLQGLDLTSVAAVSAGEDDRTMVMGSAGAKASDITMSIKPPTTPTPAPIADTPAPKIREKTAEPKNRRLMFLAIGVVVTALVVTGGFMIFGSSDEAPTPPVVAMIPPVLVEPATGSSLPDGRVAFTWHAKGDSLATFTLQYSTDPNFTQMVTKKEPLGRRFSVDPALSDGVYFWRVRAGSLAARDTLWSAASSFSVVTPKKPVTPKDTSPKEPRPKPKPVITGSALIGARIEGVAVIADGELIVDGKRRDFHFPDTLVLSAGEHTIVAIYVYNGKEVTATRKITITNKERQTLILDLDTTD